jgi:excisionase family DNA binding protein
MVLLLAMAVERLTAPVSAPGAENWHLLSVREVAEACRLSEKAVRRAIDDGELSAVKLRSRLRIMPQDLAAWIAAGRHSNVAEPLQQQMRSRHRAPRGTFRALARQNDDRGVER